MKGLALRADQVRMLNNIPEGMPSPDMDRQEVLSPEQKLWSACLFEAIQCYLGLSPGTSHQEQLETREWFSVSYRDVTAPAGSFEWACFTLDIDPVAFRRNLIRIEQEACGDKQQARKILAALKKKAAWA